MIMDFTSKELERYNRNLLLKEVGLEGQKKLAAAKVLAIGAGGLGSPVLLYLAAAGVGTIGVADGDLVDLSNLQRQVLHFTPDVDTPKVQSAASKIQQLNPHVKVVTHPVWVRAENIDPLIADYDFVIDCSDNFAAKFLINDACVMAGKPFSHAGVIQMVGQTMTIVPEKSACYRCVFSQPPPPNAVPGAAQVGILGAIAGVVGTLQATEAIKFILGTKTLLTNRLLIFDGLEMKFREVKIQPEEDCPLCGTHPTITELSDSDPNACAPA